MRVSLFLMMAGGLACLPFTALSATRYVAAAGSHSSPYTNWAMAAHDIQTAVDAASAGDTIRVTNGTYDTGGRAVDSGMTNRVVVTKAVTVVSVNGPAVSFIAGQPCPTNGANGNGAIRGAYLDNAAVLAGFTLTNGFTLGVDDPGGSRTSGGGVYASAGCLVSNCVLTGNSAYGYGGGMAGGILRDCVLVGNEARLMGGGADEGELYNCVIRGNLAYGGGGASYSHVYNCTIIENAGTNRGGGVAYSTCWNSILYYNTSTAGNNVYFWRYTNCCFTPASSSGAGNITNEPGFVDRAAGDLRLSATSACINAGLTLGWMAGAADLDGNPRVVGASVDIGAYEYQVLTDPLAVEISAEDLQAVVGFALPFAGRVVGNAQGYVWRFGDGHGVTNQLYVTNTYAAAGLYEVTLTASNLAGSVAVTAVVEIVGAGYAYYVATNGSDAAAGTNWATATATIQAAADVAGRGCVIWVTNGLYDAGGRRVAGGLLTNRVVLDKPLFLRSVNGPAVTCIAGAPNAHDALDGAAAVRGVYLDSQAMLDGFTVSNGHTRLAGDVALDRSGGGVYCASTSAVITNCVITDSTAGYSGGGCYKGTRLHCTVQNNAATNYGGGVYSGVLEYCLVAGNRAGDGGGLASSPALNCVIRGNTANRYGGGAYSASSYLRNCTVAGNTAGDRAGGVYRVPLQNSLVYYNDAPSYPNFYEGGFTNCCTTPAPVGSDNITNAPGLVSALDPRLLPGAACIGRGTNQSWMSGAVDLDDYPRLTGTSVDIGAYEYYSDTVLTGLLTAAISCAYTQAPAGFELEFEALITGRAQGMEWDFGDGGRATGVCVVGHAFGAAGVFPVVLAVSNLSGAVAATAEVTIVAQDCHLYVHPGGDDGAAGTNWATALATIQAVVDASSLGCTIWVSNGTYATGGRAVQAGLTNRVAVDQAVIVRSLNGPAVTAIVGQPCPTNGGAGAGAVRCVYLGSGARLDGFTLTNGFTLSSGTEQQQGGGIWCEGTSAVVTNCRIAGCGAGDDGGGGYSGTFESCTFDGNRADHGGGAVAATLGDCTVTNNRAGLGGGAYGCTLTDSRICNNAATNTYGGGVYGGTASACLLSGNTAANSGGGAYNAQLSGCTLRSNALTAAMGDGGGAYGGTLQGCDLANNSAPGGFGGGAALADLSGCTLVSNSALYGGGAYEGNLTNCLLRWNDAPYGGGAYDSVSYNSTFHNNTASNGAGLFDGTAYDTVFSNNTAIAGGGGACAATLHRCRLVGNTANEGGGAGGGTLYTCVVMDNTADMGGGVASAESYNCTIVGNEATSFGGGTFWGTPRNCIVYYNTAFASVNAYFGWLTNCCSSPLPDGTDNFITAPRMVDYANGDVRLLSNSPCINTGTNQAWMAGARDPDGNHRVILKVVDVGAYEYTYPGMDHDGDGIETAYESGTGAYVGSEDTGTDPLVSDTDGDRVGDGDELTAGTDPTEGASFLGMLLPATQEIAEGFVVSWQSVGGKYYRLERSTNLASAFDFVVQSNIPATPVMNTVTDTTASGWGPYFYRAGVEP